MSNVVSEGVPYAAPDEASDEAAAGTPHFTAPLESVEERLRDSARRLLGVLALLLEAGITSRLTTLRDRVGHSCLLSDERLIPDIDSLSRIKTVLNRSQEL